jgi:cation diffusion facilitator CzcD-associated flavoprotein CzcO
MRDMEVLIIGGGFGGVGCAIELQRHGITNVTLLDKAPELGGTWFHNTYPGAACDVPSHLYSFSFAQRKDWTRLCSPQPEILRYIQSVAREHGVDRKAQLGVAIKACAFDDATCRWTVTAEDGRSWEGDAVVIATGQLHQAAWPKLPGIDTFDGTAFHSAHWDHDHDLRGRRVAVVGTGASAVQFVPEVAKVAGHLTVFQRSGNWFLPRKNRPYPAPVKAAIKHVPGLQERRRRFLYVYGEQLTRAIRHPETTGRIGALRSALFMRWQLRGHPELRKKVWPDYTFGCKRVLFSSRWLPALARPNVDVVTERITEVVPEGLRTADGRVHPADTIIYGTGFRTMDFMFPMTVHGAGGRSLEEQWRARGPHAHLGITVPGFPNLFCMYGPNTNTSGGSIIVFLEAQARYIRQALQAVRERGAAALDVRPEVEAEFDRKTQARFAGTAWTRCDSWYRDETGRVVTNWPGYMAEYEAATAKLDPSEYRFLPIPDRQPAAA